MDNECHAIISQGESVMNLTELASYDGRDGRRAYIAVSGTIYDVTDSPRWEDGLHPPDHLAGQDLTEELTGAPHVRTVIERFPVVGILEEEATPQTSGGSGKITIGIIIAAVVVAIAIFLIL
jgi:predicted heme/steroid binding protein